MTRNDVDFPDPLFLRILQRLDGESEKVKSVFLHLLCQEMQEKGLLELRGASQEPGMGRTLLYKDVLSGSIYEIVAPRISTGDELLAKEDLQTLLNEELRRN